MAHLDVVPVDESAPWQHPAFGADIADGAVWGRGTLDDKGCVTAICEAVERLLEAGHEPAQDVWLSFGCDEEVSGTPRSRPSTSCERRGVRPWLVLDEGGAVAHEAFPGVSVRSRRSGSPRRARPASSCASRAAVVTPRRPARNGPTVRLARAVLRIDRSPMPARLPDDDRRADAPARPAPAAPRSGRS